MNGYFSFWLAIGFFALVSTVAAVLAARGARRTVFALVMLGLLASALKIFLFQQAPQWQDINPDSITYDLNAQAFAEHWRGSAVEGQSHRLRGLLAHHAAGLHGAEWVPDDKLTYSAVIGSHEWLYVVYVAIWYWLGEATQALVIWSNALWAAFFPAAAFGIAYSLGASQRVSLVAAGLALLDPSAGVNASWLLKDTLAGFLAMAAVWAILAHLREGGNARLVIAVLALGGLGGVRYVAFLALLIAAGPISLWLLVRDKGRSCGWAVIGVVFAAWLTNGFLDQIPHFNHSDAKYASRGIGVPAAPAEPVSGGIENKGENILSAPARLVSGGIDTFRAKPGDASADDTVLRWKKDFVTNPVYAIVRSLARTLFAPYPWVAISPGLNWVSFSELYYPGVVLWIVCLPGIFIALARGVIKYRTPSFWLLALFLSALVAAYTIYHGEWSTRQRVFALPAFFALAAIGWAQLLAWFFGPRNVSVPDHKS